MKRLFLSSALLVFVSVLYSSAFAYDFSAVCESGQTLYYNITSNEEPYTVEVTSEITTPYDGYSYYSYSTYPTGNLVIPATVTNQDVTYSVTRIGDGAFYACERLTGVTIPSSVTYIGYQAFLGCSQIDGELIIPNSVTYIDNMGFAYCQKLSGELIIPNSVTHIGQNAFKECQKITSVTISESVTYIGGRAFSDCTRLTTVNFNATNCTTMGHSEMGTITIEEYVFAGCLSLANLNIGENVTNIPDFAFYDCSKLASIVIPYSVTHIGFFSFGGCSKLESIIVSSDNTTYDSRNNCNAIIETETNTLTAGCKNTIIPNSVTSIAEGAFCGCSEMLHITIPDSVSSIGQSAFEKCSRLTAIRIPDLITEIKPRVFCECTNLKSVTLPNSITTIQQSAFENTGFTLFTIPNSVIEIGERAFCRSGNLTTLTIGNGVTSIGKNAFQNCRNIETINYNATNCISAGTSNHIYLSHYAIFLYCPSLSTLNIGENVTKIPSNAFAGITEIQEINSLSPNPPILSSGAFENDITSTTTVNVPCGAQEAYATSSWADWFTDINEMPDCAGTEENRIENEMELYPNPVGNTLNITSSETISEVEIVNVMGQVVKRIEVNSDNAICNVEDLTSGVYMVRIHAASATLSQRKFVKD